MYYIDKLKVKDAYKLVSQAVTALNDSPDEEIEIIYSDLLEIEYRLFQAIGED